MWLPRVTELSTEGENTSPENNTRPESQSQACTVGSPFERTVSLAIGELVPLGPQTIEKSPELSDIDRVGRVGCELLRSTSVHIVEMQDF
jgi:hypothetical protein